VFVARPDEEMNLAEVTSRNGNYQWFALKTVAHEKTVAELLGMKGFENFLPLYRSRKKWSDRVKEVHLPFFPGYVFCKFDPAHRLPILTTYGVSFVVGSGRVPVPVSEAEIAALKKVVASGVAASPCPFLAVGERIEIVEGPLQGLEGLLTNIKSSCRVVVSVSLLQRSLSAEIDRHWVRRLPKARQPVENRSEAAIF
jgi:transcription antitermination factor NusG